MDGMDDQFRAAQAVTGAARESLARSLRAALRVDSDAELASRIRDAMDAPASPRARTFWSASGHAAIGAVQTVTGVPEGNASLLVGAAMHALILGGADLTEQAVIRLAGDAVTWERGRTFGEATAGALT